MSPHEVPPPPPDNENPPLNVVPCTNTASAFAPRNPPSTRSWLSGQPVPSPLPIARTPLRCTVMPPDTFRNELQSDPVASNPPLGAIVSLRLTLTVPSIE